MEAHAARDNLREFRALLPKPPRPLSGCCAGRGRVQRVSYAHSPAALQLIGYASASQRAAGVSRLVPHALLFGSQPEDRLALGEADPHPLPHRVRLFARKCENVAQEGFNALVHRVSPPYRLSA
jgi:hypothetical protein